MPRNGSGTYSVPNTFTPNTIISSSAVNANFSDAGAALTGSLARDGQGGMTGQLKAVDGTVAAPGICFVTDANLGFRRSAENVMRWVAGGQDRYYVDDAGKFFHLGAMDIDGLLTGDDATFSGALAAGSADFTGAVRAILAGATPLTLRRTETSLAQPIMSIEGGDGTGNKAVWTAVNTATAVSIFSLIFGGNTIVTYTSARQQFVRQAYCPQASLTDAESIAWNWDTQQVAKVTLTANRTLAVPSNAQIGATAILAVTASGSDRTLTFAPGYVLPNGVTDPLTIGLNSKNIIGVYYDGVDYYANPSLGWTAA